jgi:DNA-binding NarL/FixJ family response regulator
MRTTVSDHRHPTPRELQVLVLICHGHSTKQIARLLGISFKTVACHRMRLMEKAAVHDPIRLFRWALQSGYVEVDSKATGQGASD